MSLKYNRFVMAASALSLLSSAVMAETPVLLMESKYNDSAINQTQITQLVKQNLDIDQYQQVKTQLMYNYQQRVDHILVYLFSKKYHHFTTARLDVNSKMQVTSMQMNYRLSPSDLAQQPGITAAKATCPDNAIEFIAFVADVYTDAGFKAAKEVAAAAEGRSLKTAKLWRKKATRDNYLNYMSCPKLKGNFYDGYSDSDFGDQIIAGDGVITYKDIETILGKKFRYKVTNIWVVDRGYTDPIKTSMIDVAQSQKYASGINELIVGPSDDAAACAMKAAINGEPMKAAFDACSSQHGTKGQWGFGGNGSDIFGT